MTISAETNKVIYTGNGATTVFPYTFKILDDDEITVQSRVTATGVITTLVKTSDYTVSGVGEAAGGNITLLDATDSPTGTKLILTRSMPQTQTVDLAEFDAFPAETIEEQFDRAVMIAQEQQEQIDRTIKLDSSITGVTPTITGTPVANTMIVVNAGATGFEFASTADIGTYIFGSGAGILAQTSTGVSTVRTLTGTSGEITVANGAGTAGNPTFSLPTALTFTGKTVTGGTFASPTITTPTITTPIMNTITGTSGFITILGTSANASGIKFSEDTDNGVNTVALQAPSAITSDRVITLPDTTGTLALTSDINSRSGSLVQSVRTRSQYVTAQTAQIPIDNTIPQNTEGTEMTTLTITPTNASNILLIRVTSPFSANGVTQVTLALFQDSIANALASSVVTVPANDYFVNICLEYSMVAGSTSPITFKLRFGPNANTAYPNGNSAHSATLGTFITIQELVV